MIIGIMSDTHGHLTQMRQAAERMVEKFKAGVIIHLGDDSTDADELRGIVPELISVPGIFESRYKDKTIPNRIIKEFEGIPFLITHMPVADAHDLQDDIDPTAAAQDGDVKVILFGHTHKPAIMEKYGVHYINPGHLNPKDNRSGQMTFAIIDAYSNKLNVKIVELNSDSSIEDKTFFIE